MSQTRRSFLNHTAVAGAATAASSSLFAKTVARALAIPANNVTGTIADVAHIVIFMQENRSFDSYYGTLPGVRGFSDPRAVPLPTGQPVFVQPNGTGTLLPYHFDVKNTNAVHVGLDHSWKGSETTWKDWNAWVAKKSVHTMGYFDRADVPYYHALADAFTVCDAYHCSIFGPTDPNRFYLLAGQSNLVLTGISDSRLYNVAGGVYNADIAVDNPSAVGQAYQSYAEVLQANGVDWKVFQEWDNYGDNYLQYFRNFRVDSSGARLTPASPLYQRGRTVASGSTQANAAGTTGQFLLDDFAAAVRAGTLPQVCYIVAPFEYCEHPDATPNAGENFAARLLDALVANPAVWAKTALFINYDENDGFFDHMPPVVPPESTRRGRSTLAAGTAGELYTGNVPVGLGPRVPMTVISPWSKGGRVCSQLFDHTSVIRFVEEWLVARGASRAAATCPNISPWRRAVCGDLTSAFNFASPNAAWPASVPTAAAYPKTAGSKDALPPAVQVMPVQEAVTTAAPRPAAPLPYRLDAIGAGPGTGKQFALGFGNTGTATAAFRVYSTLRTDGPWHYTVEPGKRIDNEVWNWSGGAWYLAVHSHNGFLREFQGSFAGAGRVAQVALVENAAGHAVQVVFRNAGTTALNFRLADATYGDRSVLSIAVPAGQSVTQSKSVDGSFGWYDLVATLDGDGAFKVRLAGHLEGAGLDFTDPVLNGLAKSTWVVPPTLAPAPPPPPVTFAADTTQVRVGTGPLLTWAGLAASATNWIGVYLVGQTPGTNSSLKWNYIATASGSETIAGLGVGNYFIGLFLDDGYTEAAPRLSLKVSAAGDVTANGTIDAADATALRGEIGLCKGQAGYNALGDLDGDHCVTQADYRAWTKLFSGQ